MADLTVESPIILAIPEQTTVQAAIPALQADAHPRKSHYFTTANARELQARAVQARKQHKLERAISMQVATSASEPVTDRHARRLARLERQLEQLDDAIDAETDPTRLDRLASARARLFESWRILSGIPMPGSRKPAPDRAAKPSRDVVQGEVE